jgi:hypothetical protein
MLPQTDHSPASPAKLSKIVAVSLSVPFDFGSPKWLESSGPRRESVSVPKVAVDEDRDFSAGENQIRTTWQFL